MDYIKRNLFLELKKRAPRAAGKMAGEDLRRWRVMRESLEWCLGVTRRSEAPIEWHLQHAWVLIDEAIRKCEAERERLKADDARFFGGL